MNHLLEHSNQDKTWDKWGNKTQSISSQWIYINNSKLMACKISLPNKQVGANQQFFFNFFKIFAVISTDLKPRCFAGLQFLLIFFLLAACCVWAFVALVLRLILMSEYGVSYQNICCHLPCLSAGVSVSAHSSSPGIKPSRFFPLWMLWNEFFCSCYWNVFKQRWMALILLNLVSNIYDKTQ